MERETLSLGRRYCSAQCLDPFFNECADCWIDGGNPALFPVVASAVCCHPDRYGGVCTICGVAADGGTE